MGISSLLKERCVTAGRDRTVRLWKVAEESQLVFRGHTQSIDTVCNLTEELLAAGGADGAVSRESTLLSPASAHICCFEVQRGENVFQLNLYCVKEYRMTC